jgi:hypothetical protein
MTSHSAVESPAKAEVLLNSEAGQPSDFALNNFKSLDPCFRGDDDQERKTSLPLTS